MARKSIVEATSQIMGQKEINHLADDRGPNDLERRIDELEAEVSALKSNCDAASGIMAKFILTVKSNPNVLCGLAVLYQPFANPFPNEAAKGFM